MVIATSKPNFYTKEIVRYFQIDHYFDQIVGSHLNGTRTSKTEIIEYILDLYNGCQKKDFLMIGDRKHDIIGAAKTGIDSIGVTYGYGTLEELQQAKPTYIAEKVDEIRSLFTIC